ncbi:MAG TPA: hypothetical protein VMX17_12590 [Candidatus Glassbacteria bacterium]|nr:hypothetical protein [Candidatus Glassbacteria bacterium]
MKDINKNRIVAVPKVSLSNFKEIKKSIENVLDAFEKTEDQIPDMLLIARSIRHEDGTYSVHICASPENNLDKIRFLDGTINIDNTSNLSKFSLVINRGP